jgi:hypothetical protein
MVELVMLLFEAKRASKAETSPIALILDVEYASTFRLGWSNQHEHAISQ